MRELCFDPRGEAFSSRLRNRVVSARMKGMAAKESSDSESRATPETVPGNRLLGKRRTRRFEAASRPENGSNGSAIEKKEGANQVIRTPKNVRRIGRGE